MKKTNNLLKKAMLAMCLLAVCWMPARADVLVGDVDGDGTVDIGDVSALIDYLLWQDDTQELPAAADVDGDGEVSIVDLAKLIDTYLINQSHPADSHDWVDLGLPSGTLWATCNVGANSPEDYGDYFAWGETAPKDYYGWNTYKWCNGSRYTLTKYCTNSSYGYNGFTDGKTELDPEDDAAYVNWGSSWRMPSQEQMQELCDNCNWQWTLLNGVNGYLVTGVNGNSLFLPAEGRRSDSSLEYVGSYGFYRSRILYNSPINAYGLIFYFDEEYWYGSDADYRDYGFSVRPVRVSQN